MFALFRKKFVYSQIRKAIISCDSDKLIRIDQGNDPALALLVSAARATIILKRGGVENCRSLFNKLYQESKSASDPTRAFMKLYSLYLAQLRGAHSDCFSYATKMHIMPGAAELRRTLRAPKPVEKNMIGTAVTASR